VVAAGLVISANECLGTAVEPPALIGIPIDFILFALTLAGIALFHRHALAIAVTGLAVISLFKIAVSPFAERPGLDGWLSHLGHEWVLLANLLGLLLGFALLSKHFEASNVPARLPQFLPRQLERRPRAAGDDLRAVELSRQHRRGAHRRHDRGRSIPEQGAHRLAGCDRRRVERRRLG
jgi:hypothetical protein